MALRREKGALLGPPPPPRPVKRYPIKVGGNIQQSKLIKKVEPVYPELAKMAQVQGSVVLVATVDEEGNVTEIRTYQWSSFVE